MPDAGIVDVDRRYNPTRFLVLSRAAGMAGFRRSFLGVRNGTSLVVLGAAPREVLASLTDAGYSGG